MAQKGPEHAKLWAWSQTGRPSSALRAGIALGFGLLVHYFADEEAELRYCSAQMKTRIACVVCTLAMSLGAVAAPAAPTAERRSPVVRVADAVIVRPIAFAATVVGTALFAVSLPVTAPLKKSKPVAEALVHKPVKATFQRPLGDMDALSD